jgi:hypothetical protein
VSKGREGHKNRCGKKGTTRTKTTTEETGKGGFVVDRQNCTGIDRRGIKVSTGK